MKTAEPKIIYLQVGDDADIAEFKPEDFETNTITWCWEKIFKNDIEYISKQSIIELIEDIQTTELLRGWKHTSDILEELIAKIKEVKE